MPQRTTQFTTNLTPAVGVKVSMDEDLTMLPFDDVPFQNLVSQEGITNIRQDWLQEKLNPQTLLVNATSALASATITSADTSGIRVGDILKKKGGTVMAIVTANNIPTNTTLTVTRPAFGATDEALAANDVLEVVGQYLAEGADPQLPRGDDFGGFYNVTQVFQEFIQASRTSRKNEMYGWTDPFAHDQAKRFRELAVRAERMYIHGVRSQSGSNRTMGGVLFWLGGNGTGSYTSPLNKSGVKANALTLVGDMLEKAYAAGGTPKLVMCSPAMKRAISQLGTPAVTAFEQKDDQGIGRIVTMMHTDFGDVRFEKNRHIPTTKGFLLDEQYISRLAFQPYFFEVLAKTGDSDKGEIVGEFSLKVKHHDETHGVLTLTDVADAT